MADSYVCSGAVMRCTFGTSTAKLRVLPDRTVWLAGQRMANIMDHKSMANIPGFGRCRTVTYPATGAATAAHHGHLTPMPCIPGTLTPWMPGKTDYLIQGPPALLKSCKCMCQWGGVITITDDGQHAEGTQWVNKESSTKFNSTSSEHTSSPSTLSSPLSHSKTSTSSLDKSSSSTGESSSTTPPQQCVANRKKLAEDFYRENAPDRLKEKDAIDYDCDVSVIELPAGTKVYRYCEINADGTPRIGKYVMPEYCISNPGKVGTVGYCGDGNLKKIQQKQLCEITLKVPMKVLRSTSKRYNGDNQDYKNNVADNWSVRWNDKDKHNGALTEGGGIQMFIPGLDRSTVEIRPLSDHEAAKLYQ